MAAPSPVSDYVEESNTARLKKKAAEAPFVPIGILGTIGMLGWGMYRYNKRGKMPTSIFLMHLRVKAQSVIVGAMAIGVGYSLLKDYVFDKDKRDKYILGDPPAKKGSNGNHK